MNSNHANQGFDLIDLIRANQSIDLKPNQIINLGVTGKIFLSSIYQFLSLIRNWVCSLNSTKYTITTFKKIFIAIFHRTYARITFSICAETINKSSAESSDISCNAACSIFSVGSTIFTIGSTNAAKSGIIVIFKSYSLM